MSGGGLTASQISDLLHELGRRLQAQGVHADIKLVGGAGLSAVVMEMAADYDLAPDWLNSNAAGVRPRQRDLGAHRTT
ncbi:hypothetical protein ACSBOX_11240 [Arthrobacter sp. KN11-1C]|uniref:hypothetical protein n=1 Tax=Arthrobacter sp. KN11-1C TaxID=3445774 RepID=UPI003F9FA023